MKLKKIKGLITDDKVELTFELTRDEAERLAGLILREMIEGKMKELKKRT